MSQSVIYQYLTTGSFDVTVPSGYSNQVLVYAWGGGGGNGTGAVGGGGGYAAGVVNINAGDSVTISVGGGGGSSDRRITTQTYERTVTTSGLLSGTSFSASLVRAGVLSTTTETITVASGVIPTPGVTRSVIIPGYGFLGSPLYKTITYSAWTLVSDSLATKVGGEGLGNNPIVDLSGGAGAPGSDPEDNDAGGSGGGGAASAVFVNGVAMLVAAGGGGGGGYGEDGAGGATAGSPGGVATKVYTTPRGQNGGTGGAGGSGGGGGGYPFGGATGAFYGDDGPGGEGGYGGQNYANASVTSSSLLAGSGTNTAGTTNGYYPGKQLGTAGYDGCVIVVFQKLFTAWVKKSGSWKQVTNAYVKTPDKTVTTYSTTTVPVGTPSTTTERKVVSTSTSTHWTVPVGVTSINITAGGAGGGSGAYSRAGSIGAILGGISGAFYTTSPGNPGQEISSTLSVSPGQVITLNVGGVGGSGRGLDIGDVTRVLYTGSGSGGVDPSGLYPGSDGSEVRTTVPVYSSSIGYTGGGGAATSILVDGVVTLVAAGGAGGGLIYDRSYSVSPGGAGGGGSGVIPSGSVIAAAPGVGPGYINISYDVITTTTVITTREVPTVRTVAAGGWKQIVRGWLKKDGVWQNIATPLTLISSKVSGTPSRRAVINLVIASNTSSYNLLNTLNTLGTYYPGYSDITLTINAGVTVDSNDSSGAALTIDGLTSGDSLIVVNNGTILGRGGYGGAAGYVSTVTVGSGKNSTTTNSPQPGGYGGAGGTALAVTYATTLENNGVIYAGGGGGGGGGISFNSVGGGQGGGGAGYGPGANAGTLTAGGAGAGLGGAGGSNGANGTAGTTGATYTYSSGGKGGGTTTVAGSPGGPGGLGGKSITGYAKVTVTVTGTIVGPTA